MDRFFISAIFLLFSVSCSSISSKIPDRAAEPSESDHRFETSSANHFERLAGIQNVAKPLENSFSMDFGPQLLKVKASYLEKTQPAAATTVDSPEVNPRRYLNLFSTTSFGGTPLIGEGELAWQKRKFESAGVSKRIGYAGKRRDLPGFLRIADIYLAFVTDLVTSR